LRPDSFLVDPQLAQASGIIGAGWAILAAVEELEELRQLGNMFPRLRASSRIPDHRGVWVRRKRKVSANAETVSKPVPDRTRGHVALALLARGAMNVLWWLRSSWQCSPDAR